MKTHTENYKNQLKYLGKEVNSIIIYSIDGTEVTIQGEELNSVTPHYESSILKSVMKQLDIVSAIDIPVGTELNCKFGLKVNNSYEYIDYGNYIVEKSEKQEDTNTFKTTCYDKMLYAMKDYEELELTYPITIKNYLIAICDKLGISFNNTDFTNQDQTIASDLFVNLGYTYRDVLDQIAETTGSTICINNNDQLEVRYLNDSINETSTAEGTNINLTDVDFDILQDLLLKGNTIQNTTILPSGYTQVEYIGSTGTQYIDTGIKADSTLKLDMDMQYTGGNSNYQNCFGAIVNGGSLRWHINPNASNNIIAQIGRNNPQNAVLSGYDYKTRFHSIIDIPNLKITTQVQGTTQEVNLSSNYSSNFDTGINFWLFRRNADADNLKYYCQTRIYKLKMYQNNVLVRNFIPCYRNSDNVIGFYDYVNNVFYTNQGTGTFVKGANVTTPTSDYPTPSPEYPQPINITTGRQEVNVCGKNLLYSNLTYPFTTNGVTVTQESDGSVTLNGTQTGAVHVIYNNNFYNDIKNYEGKNIGISLKISGEGSFSNFGIKYGTGTDLHIASYPTTSKTGILNLRGYTNITFDIWFNNSSRTFIDYNIKPQVEVGNVTEYEEYKRDTYEINLGKNLFINNITTQTISGVTFKKNDDGSININGTATAGIRLWLDDYILFPKGSYTMSATMTGTITNSLYATVRNKANNSDLIYVNLNTTTLNRTATFTEDTLGRPNLYITSGNVLTNVDLYVQLEKGNVATSFSPYKTPIELCKIGNYQDKILKYGNDFNNTTIPKVINGCTYEILSTGYKIIPTSQQDDARIEISTNLDVTKYADKTFTFTFTIDKSYAEVDVVLSNGTSGRTIYYIDAEEPGRISSTFNVTLRDDDIENNRKYLYFIFWSAVESGTQVETTYTDICLYNGTQTTYMPYGEKKWYLHKEIGKYTFTGNEFWARYTDTNKPVFYMFTNDNGIYYKVEADLKCFCNYFNGKGQVNSFDNVYSLGNYSVTFRTSYPRLVIRDDSITDSTDFKTLIGNLKPSLYYVLATPTDTEITDTELINQLESIRLLSGVNNIVVSSGNLSSPLSIAYVSNYETIDEEYIKNTRAEFGEKYGPINSIVLSRSAESDNVYIQDEDSIAENGLTELKIVDNQIMNDNTRDRFLPGLLERLDGLQYYVNDFESIGITYLELCDKYRVKIKDNYYPCVMLNNEVEVDNGLNEIIYSDAIKQSVTDYKKADKTDRRINQTNLIVDKQAQTIDAIIGTDTENFSSLTELKLETDEVSSKVESNYNFVREITANNILTSEEMQTDGLMVLKITGNANSTNYLRLNISNNEQQYVDLPIKTILKQGNLKDELSIEKIFNDETNLYEYHCFIIKRLDYVDGAIIQASSSTNYILAENSQILNAESGDNLMREQYVEGKEDLGVIDLVLDAGAHSFNINGYTGLDYYLQYAILNEVVGGFATKAHIISEINQTPEQISISADKVSLVGKTIDLTSDNININSNNFKVDMEGNMTCNNAKINGSVNSSSGNVGGWDITPEGLTNGDVKIMNTGGTTLYTVADFFLVQAHILGQIDLSNLMKHYDLNNDGVIDIKDLLLLQKILKINTE